ncbi:MAG: TonB-dependent receptor, partial [Gammaproteobacteria bacterium]|nr:TonB-dependent receptor [Gammaproteobacteria bacterium]
ERLDGNELPYAPEFSANGMIRYQMQMAEGWKGHAQFDFSSLSDHWGESDNINFSKLDGYTLLNARVGLGSETDNWSVGVWCRNLTDKEYFIYVNNLQAFGSILRTPGIPRTYGVDVSLRF